jgi:uncharacterized protein
MLEVTFYRDERDRLAGLAATGHADFADCGEDIVCAAVSAILQAARLGLTEYAHAELTTAQQEPGKLQFTWRENKRNRESVRAIVATAELAIEQIARKFPTHVRLVRHHVTRTGGT